MNTIKDVLELRCEPIKNVRVAFIGLGMRVSATIKRFMYIDGVTVVAICDVISDKVTKAQKILNNYGIFDVDSYVNEFDWKQICERPDVDLVYISTHYELHASIAVYAMLNGKHAAVEVPAALTIEECWNLVDTAEQTQRHCMMLENCNYGSFELTTLNMIQKGLLGEIIHGEGAYIHDLRELLFNSDNGYWNMWRLNYHANKNGNLYPTHGLGPLCHSMGINRGDKMDYLVSMSTNQFGLSDYAQKTFGVDSLFAQKNYKNGDMNSTLIHTNMGKTIMLQHNIASPRPYSRIHLLSGTKGFAQKWPVAGIALEPNSSEFLTKKELKILLKKYEHPVLKQVKKILRKLDQKIVEIEKNEAMDFIMDYRLIYCLQKGLPLDMNVYDAAGWSSIIELSENSVENRSATVPIPDFTRGRFNKVAKVNYYTDC